MIQGLVNQSCEAILPIVVKNNTTTQLVDAVIDTGFSGFLTLSSDIISALGLSWEGRDVATLGDGTSCTFEVYIAEVIWDGQYREVYINESETVPYCLGRYHVVPFSLTAEELANDVNNA